MTYLRGIWPGHVWELMTICLRWCIEEKNVREICAVDATGPMSAKKCYVLCSSEILVPVTVPTVLCPSSVQAEAKAAVIYSVWDTEARATLLHAQVTKCNPKSKTVFSSLKSMVQGDQAQDGGGGMWHQSAIAWGATADRLLADSWQQQGGSRSRSEGKGHHRG